MSTSYETINYLTRDRVCTITLNRPEVFNAFNEVMTSELAAAFGSAEKDETVRALILTGAGKAFCTGQDLKDLQEQYADGYVPYLGERLRKGYHPVILKMRRLGKPIVAAINGVAAGAGCSLALAADVRIMARSASLMEAFINVGLVPDCGSTFTLPRLVGLGKAMELCITGDKIPADEAYRIGLANMVVADDVLMEEAWKLADRLAHMPTKAVGFIKQLLNQSFDNTLEEQLEAEACLQETVDRTADHLEGLRAFIEKRKPNFQGK